MFVGHFGPQKSSVWSSVAGKHRVLVFKTELSAPL